jgi:hypothetical protein
MPGLLAGTHMSHRVAGRPWRARVPCCCQARLAVTEQGAWPSKACFFRSGTCSPSGSARPISKGRPAPVSTALLAAFTPPRRGGFSPHPRHLLPAGGAVQGAGGLPLLRRARGAAEGACAASLRRPASDLDLEATDFFMPCALRTLPSVGPPSPLLAGPAAPGNRGAFSALVWPQCRWIRTHRCAAPAVRPLPRPLHSVGFSQTA